MDAAANTANDTALAQLGSNANAGVAAQQVQLPGDPNTNPHSDEGTLADELDAVEDAPTILEVLQEQVLDLMSRVGKVEHERHARIEAGKSERIREVALHTALEHHKTDGVGGCEDRKVIASAIAFAAYLATGEAAK